MAKSIYQKNKDGTLTLKGYLPDRTPVEGTGKSVSVAGTTKTVYALSPSALFVPNGLVMGGTAAAAGLVTRGICGVTTPGSDGSCSKDSLYLNYDGNNDYSRKVVLGAGSGGSAIGNGIYAYTAVRGDQLKAYIEAQGFAKASAVTANANDIKDIKDKYALKTSVGNGSITIKQNGVEKGSFSLNQSDSLEINLSDTDTHVGVVNGLDSTDSASALSAYQGKVLNDKINEMKTNGIPVVKVNALPTAQAGLMGKIYIISHSGHTDDNDYYDEYIVIQKTAVPPAYAWEKIGNTDVKLDGYLKTSDIIDSLSNASKTNPLSANQGYQLNQRLNTVETYGSRLDTVEDDIGGLNTALDSCAKKTEIPTNVSQLANDSGYDTASSVNEKLKSYIKTSEADLAYVHSGALKYSDINTSYIGSVEGGTGASPYGNAWDALIRIEHRNGDGDGNSYKTEIITNLVEQGNLYWRKAVGNPYNWCAWKTILDSSNYGSFITKQWLTSALGFGSYQPIISWGSMTNGYTPVWGSDNLHGGGIHFAEKDGQTSMQINGTFRQREGLYEVIDTSTIGSQRVDYANSAGYATSAGKSNECASTTLLKAEGENFGAKIQTQYTSGAIGNLTYHQAVWYVLGNDGDTYNLAKMVTNDTFNSKLTDALKTINVEYATRSDFASMLDSGNYTSSSLSLAYDSNNPTGLTYQSWPNVTIDGNTGFGIIRGGVNGKGAFQIACGFGTSSGIYYRAITTIGNPSAWKKILSEKDILVVDNLTSTSTTTSLSANQGRVLNNKFSNYQPMLGSSVGTTMQWLSFRRGSGYSITGIWCGRVNLTLSGSIGSNASANFTIDSNYQSSSSYGTWFVCASPVSGGYVDTMAYGVEYTDSTAYGGKIWARRVYSGSTVTYVFDIIAVRLY